MIRRWFTISKALPSPQNRDAEWYCSSSEGYLTQEAALADLKRWPRESVCAVVEVVFTEGDGMTTSLTASRVQPELETITIMQAIQASCSECAAGIPVEYRAGTNEYVHTTVKRQGGFTTVTHKLCGANNLRRQQMVQGDGRQPT